MTLFGPHINYGNRNDDLLELMKSKRFPIIKMLDYDETFIREAYKLNPNVIIIGRLYVQNQNIGNSLDEAMVLGREWAQTIKDLGINQGTEMLIPYWECTNEKLAWNATAEEHMYHDVYQAAFSMEMLQDGYTPVLFNFATGNGDSSLFLEHYHRSLDIPDIVVGVHEYDWPTMDRLHLQGLAQEDQPGDWVPGVEQKGNGGCWLSLRYRRILGAVREAGYKHKVIITECGMTQGVVGGNDVGWLYPTNTTILNEISPVPESEYIATLNWYQSELAKDDYVIGACLFICGGSTQWESFESTDVLDKIKDIEEPQVPTMNKTIYGLHDDGGQTLLANNGYVLITEAIGHDSSDISGGDYSKLSDSGQTVIVRLNNGYGATGTIPAIEKYPDFSIRVANYIEHSVGCNLWIIGNEPNHQNEWPDGIPIFPHEYAACFAECVNKTPQDHTLIVAGSGPWNNSVPYTNNERGDWVQYTTDVIHVLRDRGISDDQYHVSIHTYTHGHDPNLVIDGSKMNSPFDDRHYNFYAYRDYLEGLQSILWSGPVYITEMNGNDPEWKGGNNGWCQAAYEEINAWNKNNTLKIMCGIIFRWQEDSLGWSIVDKPDVQDDFRVAVAKGYYTGNGETMFDVVAIEREFYQHHKAGNPPMLWDYPKPSPTFVMSYQQSETTEIYRYSIIGSHLLNAQENNGQIILGGCVLDENGNRLSGIEMLVGYDGFSDIVSNEKPANEMQFHYTIGCDTGFNFMRPATYLSVVINDVDSSKVDNWTTNWNVPNVGDHHCHQSLYVVWIRELVKDVPPVYPPDPTNPPTTGWLDIEIDGVVVSRFYADPTEIPPDGEPAEMWYIEDGVKIRKWTGVKID